MKISLKSLLFILSILISLLISYLILNEINKDDKNYPIYSNTYNENSNFVNDLGYKLLHNVYNSGGNLRIVNGTSVYMGECKGSISSSPVYELLLNVEEFEEDINNNQIKASVELIVKAKFLTNRSAAASLDIIKKVIKTGYVDALECYKDLISNKPLLD